jgi:hypothetical protein
MYTREILAPRTSPIEDGKPVHGTWNRAFEKVDLLEIRRPYRHPLPRWVRDSRIKEWECFSAQDDSFLLEAIFCNVKLYRMAQVILYDKEEGKRYFFRKIKPGTGWRLPNNLANASMDSHSSHFYFRIHSWLDVDTIKLDINIEETKRRPSLTIHLEYNVNSHDVTPMSVLLGISEQRSMYAYKALAPVRGDIVLGGRHIHLKPDSCSGIFYDCKGFFPYRMQTIICSAMGFDEGKRFGFHIAENQARETYKNNENALWINGRLTPLPPVRITMPNGIDSNWVIQDIEGMVDLTFTPEESIKTGFELIITNADYNVPLGYYNGMLATSEGEQIQIKNLYGIGEKLNLRV